MNKSVFEILIAQPKATLLFFIAVLNLWWVFYIVFFKKNFYKNIYKAYFFYAFFALLWVIANAYFQSSFLLVYGKEMAKIMALIANITSGFAILGFYTFSCLLKSPQQKISKKNFFFIGFMAAQSIILNLIPGLTIKDVKIFSDGNFQLIFGVLNDLLFLEAFLIIILGIINFFKTRISRRGHIENIKFLYILFGMSLMYGSLIIFHLIFPGVFRDYQYVWIPPALTILDIIIISYSILVQRFKSIKLLLSKTFKALSSFIIAAGMGWIGFNISKFFLKDTFIIYFFSAIIILGVYKKVYSLLNSESFQRLFGITDVELFQKMVSEFKEKKSIYTTLKEFENDLYEIFCKKLNISKAEIIFLHIENKKNYPYLVEYCKNYRKILVTKEIAFLQQQDKKFFDFFRELKSLGEICLPLYNPSEKLLGFFVLGEKLFDAVYTKEEIEAIENLNSYLSLNLTGILYNSELKKEVEEKTKILLQKNKELELKNRQISHQNKEISELLNEKTKLIAQQSDFIAVTGHELKTPLAIAILRVDHMIQTYSKDPQLKEESEGIKKSLNRLRAIIEKLYDILQYDLNKINITPEKTKIFEFLERIYEDFQPLMEEKKIQLILQNKFQRESVASIDPVYMRQLMQNLLTNAIKFTPLKGKITLSGKEDRKHFFICVADSGEGVPDETKEEIFEKFKTNHTMQSPGIGLGLYICKKIAELHNGKIWVEDNKGTGAMFCLQIPKTSKSTGLKKQLKIPQNK